jgi:integrase
MTFKACSQNYIEAHKGSWTGKRVQQNWQSSLKQYVYPILGNVPVAEIDGNSKGTNLIMQVIEPLWSNKTSTASQVRSRIENILDFATVRGYREGSNPARWRGHLDKLLPARNKVSPTKHLAAMPYAELPEFMTKLRQHPWKGLRATAARALEFTILTGGRISETLGATRSEIDRKERIWTVPANRMKARKAHRVALCDAALAIIDTAPEGEYLFPGRFGKCLGETAVRDLIEFLGYKGKVTKHGFRTTLRVWGSEKTDHSREVLEMALAHSVGSAVEQAYRRTDQLQKRFALAEDWEKFCNSAC